MAAAQTMLSHRYTLLKLMNDAMARRLPPLNALKAFEAAARHLSFTLAAEELNVTQAAISHQVKGLEEHFGFPLFERKVRALRLTSQGAQYLPEISRALDTIEVATARLSPEEEAEGILTVSTAPSFLSRWLIPKLMNWQETHPEIELRLTSTVKLANFTSDDVDVAIRYGRGDWPDLASEMLFHEETFPVCSPGFLKSGAPIHEPKDLIGRTLIHVAVWSDAWRLWLRAAGVEDMDAEKGLVFDTVDDALRAAAQGLGVALGRQQMTDEDLDTGRLIRPFDFSFPVDYAHYLVYPQGALARPKIKAFREWVFKQAAR